jgi:uncharacterized membrane protein YphA (DoxX/SURF4 family)
VTPYRHVEGLEMNTLPDTRSTQQPAGRAERPWLRIVVHVLRFAFAALLIVAGVAKLLDFPGFVAVVVTYRTLPDLLLAPAALVLTLAELALGVWLLWGRRLPEAAIATVLLHLGYLAWLVLALARGLDLPNCGCFGVFWAQRLTPRMLFEDGVLLALALILCLGARRVTDDPEPPAAAIDRGLGVKQQ